MTAEQHRKIRLNYVLAAFDGLGLLVWPIALFMTAFAFDSPPSDLLGLALLWTVVISIYLYPNLWVAGFLLGDRSAKRDEPARRAELKASLPLFSPIGLGGIALLIALAAEFRPKPAVEEPIPSPFD